MSAFDRKFGKDFLSSVPTTPGVYFVHNAEGTLIYVGKAKNLRRRLSQYKNAKRRRKHQKMRSIVADAHRIEYRLCETDLAACLLENELIQTHRPKWNVEGAFYFLYPMIGMRDEDGIRSFCYTTQPELFPGFEFHGAYRSRHLTRDAFFALTELLSYVGHPADKPKRGRSTVKFSYVRRFRQIPPEFFRQWEGFLRGESTEATEALVLFLIENAGARRDPESIQDKLNSIKRFWRHEAVPLRKTRELAGHASYPVDQKERDLLFIVARDRRARERSAKDPSPSGAHP